MLLIHLQLIAVVVVVRYLPEMDEMKSKVKSVGLTMLVSLAPAFYRSVIDDITTSALLISV